MKNILGLALLILIPDHAKGIYFEPAAFQGEPEIQFLTEAVVSPEV